MKDLIKDATQLIKDKPDESKFIHYILTEWDQDMKAAFILAWKLVKEG